MKFSFKAVLFDWAHTLVDLGVEDDKPAFQGLLNYLRQKNIFDGDFDSLYKTYRELFYSMIEISRQTHREANFELVLKYLIIRHNIDLKRIVSMEDLVKVYYQSIYAKRKVFEDVIPTLEGLKKANIRMGIISNTTNPGYMKEIERRSSGLDSYFELSIYSSEVPYRKPHPSIFRLALARMNLAPQTVLFIGDNAKADVAGAQNVGMAAAWLNRNHQALGNGFEPDYIFHSLSDLLQLLEAPN